MSIAKGLRKAASACLVPLVKRAAGAYIAGDHLSDALGVQSQFAAAGVRTTIGYWDGPSDTPRVVAEHYQAALKNLAARAPDSYLSIKLTALGYDAALLQSIAEEAQRRELRLHFDAMWPETADQTRAMVSTLLEARQLARAVQADADSFGFGDVNTTGAEEPSEGAAPNISVTLPGRWRRSLDDAEWAIDERLAVRVVKGQWADPAEPNRDLTQGYLEVIERLAGRARHVAVATHNTRLAVAALAKLIDAGTSCELELLYGPPLEDSLRIARDLGVPARVYVPYGQSFLPYAMSQARRNPRVVWWLVRDTLRSRLRASSQPRLVASTNSPHCVV